MNKDSKIYVAGHKGFLGSAIEKKLIQDGFTNIIGRSRIQLNLVEQSEVNDFFEKEKPEYVFLAAAKVGGIGANIKYPVEFLADNLRMELNILAASYVYGVKKLIFLGSSCIYPRFSEQPIKEEYLLTGELEPTNEAYAIAKIAGLKLCEYYRREFGCNFISAMPSNIYGPNDNFNLATSHVLAALIRRFHEATVTNMPVVEIWGSGNQYREFTYIDDIADAIVFLMKTYDGERHINVGTGMDITIRELSVLIKNIVGYKGEIIFDTTKPDGMFRKVVDVGRIHELGWKHKVDIEEGIRNTFNWYLRHMGEINE